MKIASWLLDADNPALTFTEVIGHYPELTKQVSMGGSFPYLSRCHFLLTFSWNTIVNKLTATKTKIERSRLNMGVIS